MTKWYTEEKKLWFPWSWLRKRLAVCDVSESIFLVSQLLSVIDAVFACWANFDVLSFEDFAACMNGSSL